MSDRQGYFVIRADEDGEIRVDRIRAEEIGDYASEGKEDGGFASSLPKDIAYWSGTVVIKGEIVVPKPKKTVEEWSLE